MIEEAWGGDALGLFLCAQHGRVVRTITFLIPVMVWTALASGICVP